METKFLTQLAPVLMHVANSVMTPLTQRVVPHDSYPSSHVGVQVLPESSVCPVAQVSAKEP